MALGAADASEATVEATAVQEGEHAWPDNGAKRPRAGFIAIGVNPLVVLEVPLERSVRALGIRSIAIPPPGSRTGRTRLG